MDVTTLRTLGAVGAAALVAGTLPASAQASATQTMTFEAPAELLDDARRDRTLDEIAAFGVRSVRVLVYWRDVAPSPGARAKPSFDAADPDAYPAGSWDRLDRLFKAARERGITVFPTLTGPVPKWATKGKRDNVSEPNAKEFEAFATAVGRRYGDQVTTWSIWNEPNHPQFLAPQFRNGKAASPQLYRALFVAGARGLRASSDNARDRILMGETAPTGNSKVVAPLAFLRGTLCLSKRYKRSSKCGKLSADGYAHHAYYKTKRGPSYRDPRTDNVSIGTLSRLTKALDRAARAGAIARRMPIYLTEFGIQSKPDPFYGVTPVQQAEYLALAERTAYRNGRVRAFSQYLMHDDKPRPGASRLERYAGFETGLRYADGRTKPAYDSFRLPLAAVRRGSSRVELWGRVRPQPRVTSVVVQYRDGAAWKTLKSLRTDARGVFTFRSAYSAKRRYRLQWKAPSGDTFVGVGVRAYKN